MSSQVGKSPWGTEDQHGALNRLSDKSRASIMAYTADFDAGLRTTPNNPLANDRSRTGEKIKLINF